MIRIGGYDVTINRGLRVYCEKAGFRKVKASVYCGDFISDEIMSTSEFKRRVQLAGLTSVDGHIYWTG